MIPSGQTRDLFQLQSELIDMKVDMAVTKAIDRVIEQITNLKTDMHGQFHDFRNEMNTRFSEVNDRFFALSERVTAIETKLGMSTETKAQVRSKLIDYGFRAIWAVLTVAFACLILQFQALIK